MYNVKRTPQKDITAILRNYIGRGGSVREKIEELNEYPLILAVKEGELQIVKHLLDKGADVNAVDDKGRSALWWAGAQGDGRIVARLFSAGGGCLRGNAEEPAVFHYLHGENTFSILSFMEKCSINDLKDRNNDGQGCLEYLIEIVMKGGFCETGLQTLQSIFQTAAARMPEIFVDKSFWTMGSFAKTISSIKNANQPLPLGGGWPAPVYGWAIEAVLKGTNSAASSESEVEECMKLERELTEDCLRWSAKTGDHLGFLAATSKSVYHWSHYRDKYGNTAMHVAADAGRTEVVKDLLKRLPASSGLAALRNNWGWTPLHSAAGGGRRTVYDEIWEKAESIRDWTDTDGRTASTILAAINKTPLALPQTVDRSHHQFNSIQQS